MGANCCKVTSDKPQSVVASASSTRLGSSSTRFGSSVAHSSRQITRHSPSWSFRWDHRTHIEEDIPITGNSSSRFSNTNHNPGNESISSSGNGSPEIKLDKPLLSKDGPSSLNPKLIPQVQSMESNSSSPEIKFLSNVSVQKSSDLPEPSRRTRRSPGYTLYRQVSDSRIPSLKSSFNSLSNISPSPEEALHSLSNNSSENWSTRTFSELVGSASFDSVITKTPSSPDPQSCKICSRGVNERSPFGGQKIYNLTREKSVIAVLVCGHVYHADCLESVTKETDKYEPNCPVCTFGDKFGGRLKRVARNAVVDLDVDAGPDGRPETRKGGKGVKRGFGRPVLRRYFSTGMDRRRIHHGSDTKNKGFHFWGRVWKD